MENTKATILLVEDDVNLGYILKDYLEMSGFDVILEKDGVKGLQAFNENHNEIDICVFDIMMPYKDGFSLAEDIRKDDKNVPIIFLSAKEAKEDRIRGLKLGADDYITKPFSTEELLLRIKAILRRYRTEENNNNDTRNTFKLGKYTFDYANQRLIDEKNERTLTKTEANVLRLLCLNMNQLLRREIALKTIWGENDYFKGRSMDVYITKLRKYLKDDENITIANVHGAGFKLEVKGELN